MRKHRRCLGMVPKCCIGMLLLGILGIAHGQEANPLKISGELTCLFLRADGKPQTNQTASFQVTLSGSKRKLMVQVGSSKVWTYHWDGQTAVCSFDDGRSSEMIPLKVFADAFPVENYFVQVPWFAFADAELIRAETPVPWAMVSHQPLAHAYTTHPVPDSEPPHLLLAATFVTSRARAHQAGKARQLWVESLPEADFLRRRDAVIVPQSFTAAEYRVLGHSEHLGLHLPTSFELVRYHEPPPLRIPAPPTNRVPAIVFTGRVVSVEAAVADTSFAEVLPDSTVGSVVDYRFRDLRRRIDFVTYQLTNSTIPSATDPKLLALFAAKKKLAPHFFPDEVRAMAVWGAFAAVFLVPVVLSIRAAGRRIKQRNHT